MKINLGCKNDGSLYPAGADVPDTTFPTLHITVDEGKEKLLQLLAKKGKATIRFEPQTITSGSYDGKKAGEVTLKIHSIEVDTPREKMMNQDSDGALEDFMDTKHLY